MRAKIRPRAFGLLWFSAALLVLPLTALICILLLLPVLRGLLGPYDFWRNNVALACAVFGLTNGCCIGLLQQSILRYCFQIRLRGWWKISTVGGLVGALLAFTMWWPPNTWDFLLRFFHLPTDIEIALHYFEPVLFYLAVFSFAQAGYLRRYTSRVWRWLAAHLLPLGLAAALAVLLQHYFNFGGLYPDPMLFLMLSVLAIGLATLRLMRRIRLEIAPSGKAKKDKQPQDAAGDPR